MLLNLQFKPFSFRLLRSLQTAQGLIEERSGWLLRLQDSAGCCGWGEVAPFDAAGLRACGECLTNLGRSPTRAQLDSGLQNWPAPMAFGLGAALAELDGLVGSDAIGGWLMAPESAILLPAGEAMLVELDAVLTRAALGADSITVKWKVAAVADGLERSLLLQLLERLPGQARFRLDANGGWDRHRASRWLEQVKDEPRFEWLEQPLPAGDIQGLKALAEQGPVALDESLRADPSLREAWPGWQVRRPLLEGDPRPLLQELQQGAPQRMLSTAFETGIGRRWLEHLSALQMQGPTPTAPGLAPGWCPEGPLFSPDPELVWAAA